MRGALSPASGPGIAWLGGAIWRATEPSTVGLPPLAGAGGETQNGVMRGLDTIRVDSAGNRDLSSYAAARGLERRGGRPQVGYLLATCPWHEKVLVDVARGALPGGTPGVLAYEARPFEQDMGWLFPTGDEGGARGFVRELRPEWSDLLPIPTPKWRTRYIVVPFTLAGARVNHTGAVTGLRVMRAYERGQQSSGGGTWARRPLDDIGLDDWVADVRKRSDDAVVDDILRGPVREALAVERGPCFELEIGYGQVVVAQQDFLGVAEELDALAGAASLLAEGVRSIVRRSPPRQPFGEPLPEPEWLPRVAALPGDKHTFWPVGALLERVYAVATARGMALEDSFAFHRAFANLPLPGEAFGVLRGPLPGGGRIQGRLACCAERPMQLPMDLDHWLKGAGGDVGCDVAMFPAAPETVDTPDDGERVEDLRVAVRDGVMLAWRRRPRWQADGEALDRLASDAVRIAAGRGILATA